MNEDEGYYILTHQAIMQLVLQEFNIEVSIRMAGAIFDGFKELMIMHGHLEEHNDNNKPKFVNKPLKFEEIEKGVPVWNSIIDCWVIPIDIDKDYKRISYTYYFDKNDDFAYGEDNFEDGKFYRYEVKE